MKILKNNKNYIIPKAAFAAFGVYFCMYAFRKPFTVATFEGISYFGIDYKVLLIIAQVFGYFISKFLGIKIISELNETKRLRYLIAFILLAELFLFCFAVVPKPYNILFMFLNGLPLGMIWGIVFSYIEGRKATEILGLILCSSFVVSSGFVKSVGKFMLDVFQVDELWMPFLTGLLFLLPLLYFGRLLERLPKPTDDDIACKSERLPLGRKGRRKLLQTFSLPLVFLSIVYVSLTVVRDFRDNFAREIWDALGYENSSSIYTFSEIPIAITVLILLSSLIAIKNNQKAFVYYHYMIVLGLLAVGLSTFAFINHYMSPFYWMMLSGIGMYLCYIPFNGIFFDRMIAAFKIKGNVGFLIYFIDSIGYLGSIAVLLYKNFGTQSESWLNFYLKLNFVLVVIGVSSILFALFFFQKIKNKNKIKTNLKMNIVKI
jgi:MFS family permease